MSRSKWLTSNRFRKHNGVGVIWSISFECFILLDSFIGKLKKIGKNWKELKNFPVSSQLSIVKYVILQWLSVNLMHKAVRSISFLIVRTGGQSIVLKYHLSFLITICLFQSRLMSKHRQTQRESLHLGLHWGKVSRISTIHEQVALRSCLQCHLHWSRYLNTIIRVHE